LARFLLALREARLVVSVRFIACVALACAGAAALGVSAQMSGADDAPPVVEIDRTVQGKTVDQWHQVAQRYLSRERSLAHAVRFDPETSTALNLACTVYGHCSELWRKARCESHLWRYAHNPSGASGLLQFLPSTWASTPYGRFSVYDPYANALAAGWMHAHGRGGEWVCQ
jgi:hypothetical protein